MINKIHNPAVADVFTQYPPDMRKKLLFLRTLILETAAELGIDELEETLKWGEPSYIAKQGSAIRMDWKARDQEHYALYFNCNTSLVKTFEALYGHLFCYDGNRAIVFTRMELIPVKQLKHCIGLALQYHRIKHLPLLGSQIIYVGIIMKYGMQAVITAQTGKSEELAGLLLQGADALQGNPDCDAYLIQVSVSEPDKIYISEVWANEQAHKASLTDPVVRAVIARAMPLIAAIEAKPTKQVGGKLSC